MVDGMATGSAKSGRRTRGHGWQDGTDGTRGTIRPRCGLSAPLCSLSTSPRGRNCRPQRYYSPGLTGATGSVAIRYEGGRFFQLEGREQLASGSVYRIVDCFEDEPPVWRSDLPMSSYNASSFDCAGHTGQSNAPIVFTSPKDDSNDSCVAACCPDSGDFRLGAVGLDASGALRGPTRSPPAAPIQKVADIQELESQAVREAQVGHFDLTDQILGKAGLHFATRPSNRWLIGRPASSRNSKPSPPSGTSNMTSLFPR